METLGHVCIIGLEGLLVVMITRWYFRKRKAGLERATKASIGIATLRADLAHLGRRRDLAIKARSEDFRRRYALGQVAEHARDIDFLKNAIADADRDLKRLRGGEA